MNTQAVNLDNQIKKLYNTYLISSKKILLNDMNYIFGIGGRISNTNFLYENISKILSNNLNSFRCTNDVVITGGSAVTDIGSNNILDEIYGRILNADGKKFIDIVSTLSKIFTQLGDIQDMKRLKQINIVNNNSEYDGSLARKPTATSVGNDFYTTINLNLAATVNLDSNYTAVTTAANIFRNIKILVTGNDFLPSENNHVFYLNTKIPDIPASGNNTNYDVITPNPGDKEIVKVLRYHFNLLFNIINPNDMRYTILFLKYFYKLIYEYFCLYFVLQYYNKQINSGTAQTNAKKNICVLEKIINIKCLYNIDIILSDNIENIGIVTIQSILGLCTTSGNITVYKLNNLSIRRICKLSTFNFAEDYDDDAGTVITKNTYTNTLLNNDKNILDNINSYDVYLINEFYNKRHKILKINYSSANPTSGNNGSITINSVVLDGDYDSTVKYYKLGSDEQLKVLRDTYFEKSTNLGVINKKLMNYKNVINNNVDVFEKNNNKLNQVKMIRNIYFILFSIIFLIFISLLIFDFDYSTKFIISFILLIIMISMLIYNYYNKNYYITYNNIRENFETIACSDAYTPQITAGTSLDNYTKNIFNIYNIASLTYLNKLYNYIPNNEGFYIYSKVIKTINKEHTEFLNLEKNYKVKNKNTKEITNILNKNIKTSYATNLLILYLFIVFFLIFMFYNINPDYFVLYLILGIILYAFIILIYFRDIQAIVSLDSNKQYWSKPAENTLFETTQDKL